MATTTFSTYGTVDGSQSTTRRGFLRWMGSMAAAGALAAVAANGPSESAQAKRQGKKRHTRQNDRPQPVTKSASAAPDLANDDLAYAGTWCHWQVVCYPNGGCRRRRVCW